MSSAPVFVSLTSTSSRIGTIYRTIKSVLGQSLKPDKVILNLSKSPFLLDGGVTLDMLDREVKSAIESGDVALSFSENIGPYRKLVPTLRSYYGKDFWIATADDDVIYPETWLEGLFAEASTRNCVAAYRCREILIHEESIRPYNSWPLICPDMTGQCVEGRLIMPNGRGGILYHSSFFPDLQLLDDLRAAAPAQDDLSFRFACMVATIPVVVIHHSRAGATEFEFRGSGAGGPELFTSVNTTSGNDEAIKRISSVLKEKRSINLVKLLAASGR